MTEWTLTCDECHHEFAPTAARHLIVGPWTAHYTCPECSNHVEGPPPAPPDTDQTGGENR